MNTWAAVGAISTLRNLPSCKPDPTLLLHSYSTLLLHSYRHTLQAHSTGTFQTCAKGSVAGSALVVKAALLVAGPVIGVVGLAFRAALGGGQLPFFLSVNHDAFARTQNSGWPCKKRQMQGARLSSMEAYLRTPKQREQLQQRRSW